MSKAKTAEVKELEVVATTDLAIPSFNLFLRKGEKKQVTKDQLNQLKPQLQSGVLKQV